MAVSAKPPPSAYGDVFADIYDAWYGTLTDDDFVAALTRRLPPTSACILELGVGTGRLLHKLIATRSPQQDLLVGTDASDKMLEIARQQNLHLVAHLECGDFSAELPAGPFDAIFVGYNTLFNLPDEDSLASCLALIAAALQPNGFFMCDLVIPHSEQPEELSQERIMANGDHVTSVSRINPETRTISGEFIHIATDGDIVTRPWNVHYVLPHQLDALAEKAGLRLESRTADGIGATFTPDSSRHISTYILG